MSEQDYLLRTLRDIARRAEDDTLGIQADRLVAIANQAHAAIKKAEASSHIKDPDQLCECGCTPGSHEYGACYCGQCPEYVVAKAEAPA